MLLLNNSPVEYFCFSGGELQVKLPKIITSERVILTWKPNNAQSIILLGLTVNALTEAGIYDIDLDVLYLPYARQDRVCSEGEAFSLKFICEFLNDLEISTLRIWDVHNHYETEDRFGNHFVWHWEAFEIFARYKILDEFHLSDLVLCAPDIGARGRVRKIVNHFQLQEPIFLNKTRCEETGKITSLDLPEQRSIQGFNILIVDDICDGGSTFLEAAQVLKLAGAASLYLYVTHGIFRKGLSELQHYFSKIYCHHVLNDDLFSSSPEFTILQEFKSEA